VSAGAGCVCGIAYYETDLDRPAAPI